MPATHIEGIIVEALCEHFDALGLGVPVAYPNVHFEPNGTPYVRLTIVKNTPINHHLGGGREPERIGILLCNVCFPRGEGIVGMSDMAGAIRDHFKITTKIERGPARIIIVEEPTLNGDVQGEVYSEIPVTIPYHVYP